MSDLVAGEVRGYRAWRLSGGHLWAVCFDHRWESATDEAACLLCPVDVLDPPAPSMGCTCGPYAYYRAPTAPPSLGQAFGVVAVAGRVILATSGMKAERMTILALVTADAALGERYGVPIHPSREALLSDYPPQDHSALVDVDPTNPPWFAGAGLALPVGGNTSGFVAGMWKATEPIAAMAARLMPARAMPARAIAARVMAARLGVTAAEAGRLFQHLSAADQAEVKAHALELCRTRNTGPGIGGFQRDGRRR